MQTLLTVLIVAAAALYGLRLLRRSCHAPATRAGAAPVAPACMGCDLRKGCGRHRHDAGQTHRR